MYIGKAEMFENRLLKTHHKNHLASLRGSTKVSCGIIENKDVSGCTLSNNVLLELERILIFAALDDLENNKGTFSLPGIGKSKHMNAWIIKNEGFKGVLPKRIAYPAVAINK